MQHWRDASVCIFVALAVWYFFPLGGNWAWRLELPSLWLVTMGAIAEIISERWKASRSTSLSADDRAEADRLRVPLLIVWALACCAVGDIMGVARLRLGQIGAFAVGHVFFIIWLIIGLRRQSWRDLGYAKPIRRPWVVAAMPSVAVLTAAFLLVVPHAPEGAMRWGSAAYAVIICFMLCTAIVRAIVCRTSDDAHGSHLMAIGATLFVVSDFVLAWGMFRGWFPWGHHIVMITYYTAILLIFLGSTPKPQDASFE